MGFLDDYSPGLFGNTTFSCPKCGFVTTNRTEFNLHVNTAHGYSKTCPSCNGSGKAYGNSRERCPKCGGSGKVPC